MPGAVSILARLLDTDVKATVLLEKRCLRRRLNTSECRSCLDVCATGALSLDGRMIRLDTSRCSGCMRCTASCPNEAVVPPIDLDKTLHLVAGRQEAIITCERHQLYQDGEITVPCLGIFSPVALMALGATGCTSICFYTDYCHQCSNKAAADAFIAALARVTDHAARLFGVTLTAVQADTPDREKGGGRRSYLFNLKKSALALAPRIKEPKQQNKALSESSGRRLPLAVRLAARMVETADSGVKESLLELFSARIFLSTACTICPRCAGICPTGALKLDRTGKDKRLLFNGVHCSGCRLCELFCKQAAIRFSPAPLLDNREEGRIPGCPPDKNSAG